MWTDENGIKHVSNYPPPEGAADLKEEAEFVSEDNSDQTENNRTDEQNQEEDANLNQANYCQESLERCKNQYIGSYEANVELCEGDWEPVSALSKMAGKNITAEEHYQACLETFESKRDKGLDSCERSYERCMQN
jgi:hypothetical protein